MKTLPVVILLLTGCSTQSIQRCPHPEVTSGGVKYVAVPEALTAPVSIPERSSNTVYSVVATYNSRGDALRQCNQRLQAIRDLGMQP